MMNILNNSLMPIQQQSLQQINIDKNRYLNVKKEESFSEALKIEENKLIQPCVEKQKEVLLEKSQELESLLVYQMLSVMKPKMSEGLFGGGHAEEIWTGMLYEEYATQISKTADLGLANQIYEDLSSHLK